MANKSKIIITEGPEEWLGRRSLPRVQELLAAGLSLTKIAERFGVVRNTIYAQMKRNGSPATPKSAPGKAAPQTTKRAKGMVPEAAKPSASAPNGG